MLAALQGEPRGPLRDDGHRSLADRGKPSDVGPIAGSWDRTVALLHRLSTARPHEWRCLLNRSEG